MFPGAEKPFSSSPPGDSTNIAGSGNMAASVAYRSQGKLVILSRCAEVGEILESIPSHLDVLIALTERCSPILKQRMSEMDIRWMDSFDDIRLQGYLGKFRVEFTSRQKGSTEPMSADLVLDLLNPPVLSYRVPPVGYFAKLPRGDAGRQKIAQLGEWVGEFDKPKYFNFDARLCAHQSSGITGCTACIDHCPAHAVYTDAGSIHINPYLCQGCGDCATVCPSGAVRYDYPAPEITLNRIRNELSRARANGDRPCVLLFHSGEIDTAQWTNTSQPPNADVVFIALESPGAAGAEIWLASMAYGASGVLVLAGHDLTPETRDTLTGQIDFANQILEGAGFNVAIHLVADFEESRVLMERLPKPAVAPAAFAGLRDKRTVIRLALDHLTANMESLPEFVALAPGAPFGEIIVDTDRCTLCMACVSVCPESALNDGLDEPRLSLIEANCVQCGICKKTCPEDAIELGPRYLFNSVDARKARMLHRDTPFCCIECGRPFATGKIIEKITGKLRSHPMFQGEGLKRLLMCEECRVKSFFSTQ
jgi:ferredoxin